MMPPRIPALLYVAALGCSTAPSPSPAISPPADSESSGHATAAAPDSSSLEPGSSWVEASVANIRVDRGDAGGMRGCTGGLTPEAKTFFTTLYGEALKCSAAAPSATNGAVTFHSTLEEGGGLSEFSVIEDKLGAPEVIECIQAKALEAEFPKIDPKTPCVQLVHPLSFP